MGPSRCDEVDVKKLSQEEQERFQQSDKIEWDAILKTKAVRVAYGKEAVDDDQSVSW